MSEKKGRYVTKASLRHITANDEASSMSGDFIIAHHSPALLKRKRTEGRKRREKFYIYSDGTHTHLAGAGSTLKDKRKKKADTTTGKKPEQRRGEGNERTSRTNLRGETDLTKSRAHT